MGCRSYSSRFNSRRRNCFVIAAVVVSLLTMWVWIRLLQGQNNIPDGSNIMSQPIMTTVFVEREEPGRIDFWDDEKKEPPLSPTCQPTQHLHLNDSNFPVLKGPRDDSFRALADLLNSREKLFDNWHNSASDYTRFIHGLTSWILSPPADSLQPLSSLDVLLQQLPRLSPTNCNETRYANVLTGRPLSIPRVMVDFLLFDGDVDNLEIRLYEYYQFVDAFVVFETPKTMAGFDKILYFKHLRSDPRFLPFMSKIIYLSITTTTEWDQMVENVQVSLTVSKTRNNSLSNCYLVSSYIYLVHAFVSSLPS